MLALAVCFAWIALCMKVCQHRWWWYGPRFRIKTARQPEGPVGADIWGWACPWEYICVPQRPWQTSRPVYGHSPAVPSYMPTPPLFADGLIGSCMWDGEMYLSELYMGPQKLHKQPHDRWRMLENVACVCLISYFEMYSAHTALAHARWICVMKSAQWFKSRFR